MGTYFLSLEAKIDVGILGSMDCVVPIVASLVDSPAVSTGLYKVSGLLALDLELSSNLTVARAADTKTELRRANIACRTTSAPGRLAALAHTSSLGQDPKAKRASTATSLWAK
jgi:hypothetical protein